METKEKTCKKHPDTKLEYDKETKSYTCWECLREKFRLEILNGKKQ